MSDQPQSFAGALGQPPSQATEPPNPLMQREADLLVDYTSKAGRTYKGTVRNRILTNGQRVKVDLKRADRSGGVTVEAMSAQAYMLLYVICWMEESLISAPDWAKNLTDSLDEDLVGAIWKQVTRHEDTFSGRRRDTVQS